MISSETVTRVWQEMAETPTQDAPILVSKMKQEQPVILAYLMASEGYPFNQHEVGQVLYIGIVVWQIMEHSEKQLLRVTRRKLDWADSANERLLEILETDTEADFISATRTILKNHPEPEVLGYIIEALMEEEDRDPDDPPIRDEYRGLAFIHLKTVLDAFISSLAK